MVEKPEGPLTKEELWEEMHKDHTPKPVLAQTRRLSAQWTMEIAQELQVMHGLDVEQEIIEALAHEMLVEMGIKK